MKSDAIDYYFKISQVKNQIRVGDHVAFLLISKNDKLEATSIRKVFTNTHNIRVVSRARSHQHDGVEDYLVYIMNEIKDYDQEFLVKQIDPTSYLGVVAGVEPYDTRATKADLEYWSEHAFIDGSEPIIEDSRSEANPWIVQMPAICNLIRSGA